MKKLVAFYVAAFGITWGLQLPGLLVALGVLPGPVERFLLFMGLGALGPALAAMLVAGVEGGRAGVRALLAPLRAWRVNPVWYAVALGAPGALFVAAMAVYSLAGGRDGGPWFYVPHEAATLTAVVFFSLGEEVGWRGFALPRLQSRVGAVRASVIVGALWCVWHVPMFTVSGIPLWMLALMLPFFIAGSVVFTWIYNRTHASLLLAVLTHAGSHLNNSHKALPGNVTPVLLHTVAYCVLALVLLAADRKAFRAPPVAGLTPKPLSLIGRGESEA